MAKLIRRNNKFMVVSHKFNTAGNPIQKGQKKYVIATGMNAKKLRSKVRKIGYSV